VAVALLLIGLFSSAALAQEPVPSPGGGIVPTYAQLLDVGRPKPKLAQHGISGSPKGDAGWSMPISVPPALMAPSLSVSYSSAGAFGDEGGAGWSISGALEITRPTAPGYPADTFLVSGPEVSGLLRAEGGSYTVRAPGGGRAWADYDAGTDQWTVSTGDVSFVLEPLDEAPGPNTARWRVTEAVDLLGNRVTWAWHADGRHDAVTYGGNVVTGDPALIQVEATYIASLHAHTNGASGSLEVFDHVLDRVVVSSLHGAAATPELAWSFHWSAGGGTGLKQVVSMADEAIDATRAAGAADEGGAVASRGAGEVTTLRRAVGPAELAHIKSTGKLQTGPGMRASGSLRAEPTRRARRWTSGATLP
jgi:hypothetical protein